jgi:hypothetical protein
MLLRNKFTPTNLLHHKPDEERTAVRRAKNPRRAHGSTQDNARIPFLSQRAPMLTKVVSLSVH